MTIQEYIQQNQENLSFGDIYQGQESEGEWTYDLFSCNLNGFVFPYKMGIGNRIQKQELQDIEWDDRQLINQSPGKMISIQQAKTFYPSLRGKNANPRFIGSPKNNFKRIGDHKYRRYFIYELAHPTLARCLESLLSDYKCIQGQTFEEFCSNIGYNPDSRKAEKIYRTILENSNQLSGRLPNWQNFIQCEAD